MKLSRNQFVKKRQEIINRGDDIIHPVIGIK